MSNRKLKQIVNDKTKEKELQKNIKTTVPKLLKWLYITLPLIGLFWVYLFWGEDKKETKNEKQEIVENASNSPVFSEKQENATKEWRVEKNRF